MDSCFHSIVAVVPGREGWRFKVRVLRLWEVPAFLIPVQPNSLEMVLIDEKSVKIHATVRKQLLYVFQKKLAKGDAYKMSYFYVAPNVGFYRAHEYKLIFQMKTKVQKIEGSAIPNNGLSSSKIEELSKYTADYPFLVDVVGLMTGISAEREYLRDVEKSSAHCLVIMLINFKN